MSGQTAETTTSSALHDQIGVSFDRRPLEQIVELALTQAANPVFYITCNLNHLRVLQSDPGFREAYRRASIVTLDSRPMQVITRLRFGERLPLVTGADLFSVLMERLRPQQDRPMFVASSQEVGAQLCKRLVDGGFSPNQVAFTSPPFGFERDAAFSAALLRTIREHNPSHLFMGVGAPKSERWIAEHLADLPPCHVFCVGAALDFTSGFKTRAPAWLGRVGLEWTHRLVAEPRRLLPRYAGDAVLLLQVIRGKRLARVT